MAQCPKARRGRRMGLHQENNGLLVPRQLLIMPGGGRRCLGIASIAPILPSGSPRQGAQKQPIRHSSVGYHGQRQPCTQPFFSFIECINEIQYLRVVWRPTVPTLQKLCGAARTLDTPHQCGVRKVRASDRWWGNPRVDQRFQNSVEYGRATPSERDCYHPRHPDVSDHRPLHCLPALAVA